MSGTGEDLDLRAGEQGLDPVPHLRGPVDGALALTTADALATADYELDRIFR